MDQFAREASETGLTAIMCTAIAIAVYIMAIAIAVHIMPKYLPMPL